MILYNSFQLILYKKNEVLFCADDKEYRVNCQICEKLCIESYYENHLKSRAHTIEFYKRQHQNNFFFN